MKVLVVCKRGVRSRPYITEQIAALEGKGIEIATFFIAGSGVMGYLSNLKAFKRKLKQYKPDLIHAHYGLSGLLANFQRRVPVITTYHGSDINFKRNRPFSKLVSRLSAYNIFVSSQLAEIAGSKKKFTVIPCGIDTGFFKPVEKSLAQEKLGLHKHETYILFSGSFNNRIKNADLAKKAIKMLEGTIKLIELKGYTREEVMLLMNACDVALMTSLMEGSPQFIKEAMACNCPIVSTDAGSVKAIIGNTAGCYLTTFSPIDVQEKLQLAMDFGKRTNGREKVLTLNNELIADSIAEIYKKILAR